MLTRRLFLGAVSAGVLATPEVTEAQPPPKVYRIGVLTLTYAPSTPPIEAFRQGLREHGYVEAQNIALEFRFAEGTSTRLPALAAELVRLKVDVIVTQSNAATLAAKNATQTIPIVMAFAGDPVTAGMVGSLARPGANVTGLSLLTLELSGKRLQLLKEVAPKTTLVVVFWNPTNPSHVHFLRETEAAAQSLGLRLKTIEVRSPSELDVAFKAVTNARPSALISLGDGMLTANAVRIVEFATKSRLPGVFANRVFPEAGALMSYGASPAANFRQAAAFVDKILKGAKPANLPVEQPTKFELVINLRTAKAIGLTIPPSLLQRADQIID